MNKVIITTHGGRSYEGTMTKEEFDKILSSGVEIRGGHYFKFVSENKMVIFNWRFIESIVMEMDDE